VPWGDPLALSSIQRSLDVDILISGHTHKNEVTEYEGKWFCQIFKLEYLDFELLSFYNPDNSLYFSSQSSLILFRFINPGSVTGSFSISSDEMEVFPSFILLGS